MSLLALALAATLTPAAARQENGAGPPPHVHDARLHLSLFAADPDIVTPIGVAVDAADRVYVLESHTHLQPSDYKGPAGDLVKVFTDEDRDGRPDRITVFAEDIDDGMNLAFSPAGELYVVAAKAVWALHDRDGDGRSESRTRVLTMTRPEKVYDHAALLGITFSSDGWMYISRGNTGSSPWRVEGTDGSFVAGYGDGGNIIRARPDGSSVQEVATGFWNPFDLKFDTRGRLLAADNDPDSRGPNRLVHVIQGGDYGYKSLYGGSGIHPYLAWNGELPGTLPYAAALGEAPSGLLIAAHAALPEDYREDVLVTIWEESRIVRVPLEARGTSVSGTAVEIVRGNEQFRPVAFAADSRGRVYLTDWVVREYPNHGRGRIWRLSGRPDVPTLAPRPLSAPPDPDPAGEPLRRIQQTAGPRDFPHLRDALRVEDPFVRSAAITALAAPAFRDAVVAATEDPDAKVRLGALLALHRGGHRDAHPIARRLLADPDLLVRRMALVWVGSTGMTGLDAELDAAILTAPPSPELFEVYLATLEHLSPEFIRTHAAEAEPYARLLKRLLRPRFVESFIADESKPAALRAVAVTHLKDLPSQVALLVHLTAPGTPPELRREAVLSLAHVQDRRAGEALRRIALDGSEPPALRAEAVFALTRQPLDASADAVRLLADPEPDVRLEAARYLRLAALTPEARRRVARAAARLGGDDAPALRARLGFGTDDAAGAPRPTTPEAWQEAVLPDGGNAARGRRVFFSQASACSQCHVAERRGGDLGPDLTNVGRSKTRAQILDAILRPSAEISPEYQGWFIRTKDGAIHTGRQIDVGSGGKAELYVQSGEFIAVEGIVEYGPMPQSLMPQGLETNLTVEDMRDLIAYLSAPAR